MGATWNLGESRLVQFRTSTSAANAEEVSCGYPGVPAGKLWIVLGFGYTPSVAETQVVNIQKYTPQGGYMSLINPVSLNLNPSYATFIEQGMEYTMLPGEYLRVLRVAHTAGSTMTATVQLIEIDQPLYTYEEPQVVKRYQMARGSILQQLGGISGRAGGGTGTIGTGPRPPGGGGGRGGTP